MKSISHIATSIALSTVLMMFRATLNGQSPEPPHAVSTRPDLTGCQFSPWSNHSYFPLEPGRRLVLRGEEDGVVLQVEWEVMEDTRIFTLEIGGELVEIETAIVREWETEDGELVEISHNYFAQCQQTGSVFYFGETVDDFEDGELVGHGGAWLAGEGDNLPGIIMPGEFVIGESYQQEIAPGIAEDSAVNSAAGLTVEVPAGSFNDAIRIEELDPLEPNAEPSLKFYAPGVGLIIDDQVQLVAIEEGRSSQFNISDCTLSPVGNNPYFPLLPGHRLVLRGEEDGAVIQVEWEVLEQTREITFELEGVLHTVETAIVREYETEDGELTEISWNFFAHCEETGSVFYFGEEVDDYENGEVVAHSGAWLAGVDGAVPGVIMPGEFVVGDRYFQEIAPGVAEDFAVNVAEDLTFDSSFGSLSEVIRIEESTPLEPDAEPSIKSYAPGIGVVQDENLELVEVVAGPKLNIAQAIQLSWPAVDGSFVLEGSPSINGPWVAIQTPLVEFDSRFIATVPATDALQLYRIRQFRPQTADPEETSVVINEFMASNQGAHMDPSGGFDDWIELRNTTTEAVDLSGMYLSDDPANLRRWQFPPESIIPAEGYLIVWADGDEEAAGLHASFRLAAAGETLVLVGPEGNLDAIIDTIEYEGLEPDQAFGRLPDDPEEFGILPATPGKANHSEQ